MLFDDVRNQVIVHFEQPEYYQSVRVIRYSLFGLIAGFVGLIYAYVPPMLYRLGLWYETTPRTAGEGLLIGVLLIIASIVGLVAGAGMYAYATIRARQHRSTDKY